MIDAPHELDNLVKEPVYLEKNWISFSYLGQQFGVDLLDSDDKLYRSLRVDREKEKLVKVIARDSVGAVDGYLNGKLYQDDQGNNIFELLGIQNKGISDGSKGIVKKEGHVPNLMREVVVSLVNSDKVDMVISCPILSDGAKIAFDRVLADERIVGEKRYLAGDEKHENPYYVFSKN